MARVLLITGWGGGTGVLTPLQNSLQQLGHEVELLNIFNALDPDILQQQTDYALNFDVLMGWSLGESWQLYWPMRFLSALVKHYRWSL